MKTKKKLLLLSGLLPFVIALFIALNWALINSFETSFWFEFGFRIAVATLAAGLILPNVFIAFRRRKSEGATAKPLIVYFLVHFGLSFLVATVSVIIFVFVMILNMGKIGG